MIKKRKIHTNLMFKSDFDDKDDDDNNSEEEQD